jgi:hypothetical protein
MDPKRRETCWHEAGHAVASRKLSRWCGGAWLIDGGKIPPELKSLSPEHERLLRGADGFALTTTRKNRELDAVLIDLAGAASVIEFLDREPSGCQHDFASADRRLAAMGIFDDIAAARRSMLTQARDWVSRHRKQIRRVAIALRARGQLSGEEIDELIRWT